MPLLHAGRPLKRWRYVGAWGPDVLLCAGAVRIGGLPQSFWATWDRGTGVLAERTRPGTRTAVLEADEVRFAGARLQITAAGEPVETVSPHGHAHAWTRKVPLRVTGTLHGASVDLAGLLDESAGYHARRTSWCWSAGAGRTADGRDVVWNLVAGLHDDPAASERTVWLDGAAAHVGPVAFDAHLGGLTGPAGERLSFRAEAQRARHDRLPPLLDSRYRQPFGAFTGTLPGGASLLDAAGVMECHDVRW
jgi:hypothetical protein